MTAEMRQLAAEQETAYRSMLDAAKDLAKSDITPERRTELQAKFDKAEADQASAELRMQNLRKVADLEKRNADDFGQTLEQRGEKPTEVRDTPETRKAVFETILRSGPTAVPAEYRDVLKAMTVNTEMRGTSTQIAGTTTLGGYLVPTLLQNEIVNAMKDYSGILQVARVIRTSGGGPITYPKTDFTSRAAVKTAESGSIAVQDITFGQLQLDSYKYTDLLKLSWELLQDSAFDVPALFTEAFANSFGRAMNNTLTLGDGTGDPNGVVTASTAGKTAASATAFTLAELLDLKHSVDPAYRRSATSGWMFNDTVLRYIKGLSLASSNNASSIWQPSFRDGEAATIDGHPYWINQDMDSSINASSKLVLFGDFSKYIVRMVQDMSIMRNDALYMATGEVGFFAHARWDGDLGDTTAIKHLITAAS